MPRRYVLSEDGKWHCPPAEATANAYGFSYRIWTPSEVSGTWLRNIQLLSDYFDADLALVPSDICKQVQDEVSAEWGLSLEDLRRKCEKATADHLNTLIVQNHLYVDLAAAPLTDTRRVRVFSCREAAETFTLLAHSNGNSIPHSWSGKTMPPVNGHPVGPEREDLFQPIADGLCTTANDAANRGLSADTAQLFRRASPEEYAIANRRYRILTNSEFAKANPTPERTVRRWRRLFRLAEERYGFGLLGLIPRFRDRGNRGQYFCNELLAVVDKVIDEVFCTPSRPNRRHAFDRLSLECKVNGFPVPSYGWFTKRISSRSKFTLTLAREGKRAAHRYELIRPGEPNDNHGAFPWNHCLTDHTQTDVELVCSETGENLGRAWLSILLDGFSRRVLAFHLTYDPPSYRTLMVLVRRCVERHGRLPGSLVVDGGREFQSVYFETLTAAYQVELKRRPPGKARFGSLIERMFGTVNTQFLHTLKGNTQNTRNIRQLTKSMNPRNHASYCLEEMHAMLATFVFEIYDNRPHPALNCAPKDKYDRGIEISGAREHRSIKCDETFYLMTLPSTAKGSAKIQPGMGLKIGGFYYWASEMRSRSYEGRSVKVKYDPENIGVGWAYLGDQWVQCRPNGTLNLEGRTEKEMQLATLEWRRSRKLIGLRQSTSLQALAEFLKTSEATNALRIQQAKDRALRRIQSNAPGMEEGSPAPNASDPQPAPSQNATPHEFPKMEPTPLTPMEDYGDL